ncbi:unnamed protein product [Oikopleura dioica]|uniref:S1 motif domain-containing protein n=1 Tax=Oikopleura dioica TaxID=34765 RepID=E4XQJ1_OIKDI|nr:unnamed protein product [Oikopleura dioica]CBY38928.1 unnamed protein product [Oikopleura dioica]
MSTSDVNCVPGERLGSTDECEAGRGTYVRKSFIYASRIGKVKNTVDENKKIVIEVIRKDEPPLPQVGSIVTAKIVQVTQRQCRATIYAVDGIATSSPFKGLIRREDVRRTERDRVELSKCFRPNDIVFAKVMSLGDSQSYLLSTGGDELGVVLAKSRAGVRLEPISWNEMRCPLTGVKEQRKTARIRAEFVEMQPAAKA